MSSWPAQPWLAAALVGTAAIYLRGWRSLQRRDRVRWNAWKPAAFLGGLSAMYLALASPIEAFAPFLLQVHMVQHLFLMMVVPPLVWLGAPMLPLLRGLPVEIRRYWAAPILRWRPLGNLMATMTHPVGALIIFTATTWLCHLPAAYQLALESNSWHAVQHLCFLAAGLVFWYPVVRPFPARPTWPLWLLVPYLLLADIQNTIFSALLTFSNEVWYPHYLAMPHLDGMSVLDDQAAAGVTMWVPGSIVFLLPLACIGLRLMQGKWGMGNGEWGVSGSGRRKAEGGRRSTEFRNNMTGSNSFPIPHSPFPIRFQFPHDFDFLRHPLFGSILRWRWTRRIVQMVVLLFAVAVIVDGLLGPQIAPMNLAGVVPWIHWRGLIIIGLLAVGNVFCYGCPFMLPRTVARSLSRSLGGREWPHWLRSKWLAVALMALFLWAYEALALWNNPWITAWIAIAYFAGALLIDGIFRDAAFCKYVCPIGQFNFVQSLVSPLEVRVREPSVCTNCRTHDCIRGRVEPSPLGRGQGEGTRNVGRPLTPTLSSEKSEPAAASRRTLPGCELHLFQPRKVGNLDCTFCLDCVQACPHENVGVIAVAPAKSLWRDGPRSGMGHLNRRLDYAALAIVLIFGAFANAAGMVSPIVAAERQFAEAMGTSSTTLAATVFYAVMLFAIPAASLGAAATLSRRSGCQSIQELACRFAWSLVPLGFAMWLAHYSFHFFTSFDTIVPAAQRFAADFRLASLGSPDWVCSCCRPAPDWLLKAELMSLDIGLLVSLYAVWRIARHLTDSNAATIRMVLPWAALLVALFAFGVWILLQPMEMRGTLPM